MKRFKRDKQRSRAYFWEDALVGDAPIQTEQEINQAFSKLRMLFQFNEGKLILHNPMNHSASWQLSNRINLISCHHTFPVLCHEFAHLVVWYWYEKDKKQLVEAHGKEWLTVYMILLNHACGIPVPLLIKSANDCKLEFEETLVRKYEAAAKTV